MRYRFEGTDVKVTGLKMAVHELVTGSVRQKMPLLALGTWKSKAGQVTLALAQTLLPAGCQLDAGYLETLTLCIGAGCQLDAGYLETL